MESKSIEQLEKNVWKELSEYPTDLVEKCYQYRKVSISELNIEQIRLLVSQQIGLEHIIGISLNKLEQNILAEGHFYAGDLLVAVSGLPTEFWHENKNEFLIFINLVMENSEILKNELGEKKFDKLMNRILNGI